MTRINTQTIVQAGLACAIAVFAPAASCDGGDRNVGGACPDQEVCADGTEDGLHFVGPIIGDGFFDYGELKTIAHGGTQTVRLEVTADHAREAFDLPYDAAIDGAAAHIETQQANVLVLRGDASEDDYLRITDPADGALYDRIRIATREVGRIGLARSLADLLAKTPDGLRVVDDTMVITGAGVTQTKWDELQLGNLGVGSHPITVVAAGRTSTIQIPVAAGPDRLELAFGDGADLELGSHRVVCFAAFLGARYIHVPWTFEAENADVEATRFEGCVDLVARSTGTVTIHAQGGGLAIDRTLTAVMPPGKPQTRRAAAAAELRAFVASQAPGELHFGDTAGERAAMRR